MKLKYFLFLFLTLTIFHQTSSIATIRYVSKTGTSIPPYTSWLTSADSIQKCINICVAGDTIYVANGVYKENLIINTQIFLSGLSMDSTIVDGTGMGDLTVVFNVNGNIQNFNIFGKAVGVGVPLYSITSSFPIIEVSYCRISNALLGIGCGGIIAENLFMNNLLGGIITSGQPGSYNKIFNCVILVDGNSAQGLSLPGPNYANYYINNNLILFTGANNSGSGISVGAPRKVFINNNLISGFTDNIFFDTVVDTAFIKNNVLIFQSSGGATASIWSSANKIFVNNVILSNNIRGIYQSGGGFVRSDYNLYWKNETDLNGLTYGDSDRVADPMFVKDTIPNASGDYDFHLQAFSPAINRGDPNILDLDSTRSDIGLYGGVFGEIYTYQDLAPLAPRNLSAVVDTNQILLKWNKNTEADTSYYKVYRDTVISFQIDSTKLISSPTDTFFVQTIPNKVKRYVYKIACVDNQGHESNPSEELVVDITTVTMDDYPMTINDYLLYQNYPNPFNPSTKIGYKLKERANVKMMVYDIKGELVTVLVNKEQNAGYYEVEFNGNGLPSVPNVLASGIYLYRIEVIGEGNIPVYTEMKKMLMIK